MNKHYYNLLKGAIPAVLLSLAIDAMAIDSQLAIASVVASSNDGNVPENTLDGNLATRWSALGDGQWIRFDLGQRKIITSVGIAWYQGNKRKSAFDIQTSADGVTWTTVHLGISSGKTTGMENYNVADSTGRYVCVIGHGSTASMWNSITEVKVYGLAVVVTNPPPVIDDPPPAGEAKLAAASVRASSDDGNVPANTLDGNLATRWSALGDGQWILYDLGSLKTISSTAIAWHQGDKRKSTFDIQTSTNCTDWTTVFSGTSCGTTSNLATFNVLNTVGRYVCIVGHGNSVTLWNSISETRIYGVSAGGVTPPSPVLCKPADILDLANWKLTLPVNTAHAGSPDEIKQPELAGFQDLDYFNTNCTLDGVVFKAPCGGATTSGSGYPRSELREMANNGASLASWSTTVGTHTMVITQAITHLPVVKPHVVAGQIHDANDDVIVFRLEGAKLFIDLNGTTGPILTTQYHLGDIFTVAFVVQNGRVECYYNGTYMYTYPVSVSGCYFKAGCYTQSNTSKGDAATAYGEVVVYGVTVTHQ